MKNLSHSLDADLLKRAEVNWIKDAQVSLPERIEKGDFQRLNPTEQNGIIVVGGRAEKWMEISYDNKSIALLPRDHQLSLLYSRYVHQQSHLGISATMAKIRLKFCICG